MSNETGGNAYPQNTAYIAANGAVVQSGPQGGMTLRDYFAAKAMHGSLTMQSKEFGYWVDFNKLAKQSYDLADAMLEARK